MNTQRKKKAKSAALKWWGILLCGVILAFLAGVTAAAFIKKDTSPDVPSTAETTCTTDATVIENRVEIALIGDTQIVLEYGDLFEDPGASAVGYGASYDPDGVQLSVDVSGAVDTQKLGVYTIVYSVRFMGKEGAVSRTVTVVDTQAPIIELVSNPESYTLPGQEYEEEGYSAIDKCDGDLTDQVERRVEGGKVIYAVTDASGNRAEVERIIRYHDPVAPELTLKGDPKISIDAGTWWTDPGYSATDNIEGDITGKVKVSGAVNGYMAGTYELIYTVTDNYGNKATAKRVVTVNAMKRPEVVVPNGKVIYLTFDDGPDENTERLLQVLKKYDVKATFFVVNTGRLDLLDDVAAEGHSLGIHSKTHRYEKIYANEDAFFEDFYAMQDLIYQYSGVKTMLTRFPGGSSNITSAKYNEGIMTRLTQAVKDQGFRYFDWNVDSKDAGGAATADEVFANVIKGIQNNPKNYSVVLQHDIKDYSVDAVEQIILWGLNNGYTFLPLEMDSPICEHTVRN